jgi:large subunit ribosomal protein L17
MKIKYRNLEKKFTLGRRTDERWHLIRTLVTQLIMHERIKTTSAKAKHMQATAEYVLAKARRMVCKGEHWHKAQIFRMLTTHEARMKLINEIAPRLENVQGHCTKRAYLYNRKGDNAPVSFIEIVGKLTH